MFDEETPAAVYTKNFAAIESLITELQTAVVRDCRTATWQNAYDITYARQQLEKAVKRMT